MILEHLGEYLGYIKAHPNSGVFASSLKEGIVFREDTVLDGGWELIDKVSTWSYMTGFTYNMELCNKINALQKLQKLRCGYVVDCNNIEDMIIRDRRNNLYLELMTHDCLAMMLCYQAGLAVTKLRLWDAETHNTQPNRGFSLGYRPESRMNKQCGLLEFCHLALPLQKREFINIFLSQCEWTKSLVELSLRFHREDMLKIKLEKELWTWIYHEQIKYLESFPFDLTDGEYTKIKIWIKGIVYRQDEKK